MHHHRPPAPRHLLRARARLRSRLPRPRAGCAPPALLPSSMALAWRAHRGVPFVRIWAFRSGPAGQQPEDFVQREEKAAGKQPNSLPCAQTLRPRRPICDFYPFCGPGGLERTGIRGSTFGCGHRNTRVCGLHAYPARLADRMQGRLDGWPGGGCAPAVRRVAGRVRAGTACRVGTDAVPARVQRRVRMLTGEGAGGFGAAVGEELATALCLVGLADRGGGRA